MLALQLSVMVPLPAIAARLIGRAGAVIGGLELELDDELELVALELKLEVELEAELELELAGKLEIAEPMLELDADELIAEEELAVVSLAPLVQPASVPRQATSMSPRNAAKFGYE